MQSNLESSFLEQSFAFGQSGRLFTYDSCCWPTNSLKVTKLRDGYVARNGVYSFFLFCVQPTEEPLQARLREGQ